MDYYKTLLFYDAHNLSSVSQTIFWGTLYFSEVTNSQEPASLPPQTLKYSSSFLCVVNMQILCLISVE